MDAWNTTCLLGWPIFRFHVNCLGGMCFGLVGGLEERKCWKTPGKLLRLIQFFRCGTWTIVLCHSISMGSRDIYLHVWHKFMVNVGKYTSQWFSQVSGCKNMDQPATHSSPNLSLSQRQNGGKFFRPPLVSVPRQKGCWGEDRENPSLRGFVETKNAPKTVSHLTRKKKKRHPKKITVFLQAFFLGNAEKPTISKIWAFNWKRLFLDTWDNEWTSKILVPH